MKLPATLQLSALGTAGLAGLLFLPGCSSMSNSAGGTTATQPGAAPMVITVSDAPLGNILSAKITLSAIAVAATGGSPVSVLSKPETVELSGLGAMQEPIELTNLPLGTYNSVAVTVSAAQVTYLNSLGQPVTATATLSAPTVTVALNPPLNFTTQGEVHLQIGFNLAQSFSLSGSTVTFTPAINTSAAQVENENNTDREVEVTGQVINITSTSITVQSGDSGQQFTFTINGSTLFPSGVTPATIPQNSIVQVKGQTQNDGTLLALSITPLAAGMQSGQQDGGAKGIVVTVAHDGSGNLTGFTMVPQEDFGSMMPATAMLNVLVATSTTYGISQDAQQTGLTAAMFSSMEVFPGQAVIVTGPMDTSGNLDAAQVTLGAENLQAALATAPVASGSNLDFSLAIPIPSFLSSYEKLVTLDAVAGPNTQYGNGMTATSFASSPAATPVEVHGYLLVDKTGSYLLYASEIASVQAPETPESGN